jgi:hypothetical protein
MIAFQPFTDVLRNDQSVRARPLTVSSLASTLASLANVVGMGRVVVWTGMNNQDEEIVQETF